jgi:hypothetical protein
LQRVFVKVSVGSGNYKYLGDLNNNGIADESEFIQARFDGDYLAITVPTDELFPIIDLKTSARFKVSPARFLENTGEFINDFGRVVTSETYVRVEEKSRERDLKQIYLLHFSRFQQDSTTLTGSTLFTQDVSFFEGQPDFSARLRFLQRRGLSAYATVERNFSRERSVRVRWQLVREIANQVDYVNRVDRVSSHEASSRLRDILSNSLVFDLSYRPEQNIEVGLKLDMSKSTDAFQVPPVDANLNAQSIRFVLAFLGAGQARLEASREEILLSRSTDSLPYELTGGRVGGKTYIWRFALDYRVTQFIQANVNYDGRSEGGGTPVHTARAEVRAFF